MTSSVMTLWENRNALGLLVRRDLAVKYQQSLLGYLWSLIEPLGVAAIYWFVFGVLYGTGSDRHLGDANNSYPLFLITGIFAWSWANAAMGEATSALTGQARLITTMKVARQVFPIGRVLGRFAEFLAGLPILIILAIVFGELHFDWQLLALPLAVLLQTVFLTGLALLLSSLNVLLRDVEKLMRLGLRVLFYATPIIYPLAMVQNANMPGWAKDVYELNPLVGIMELYHAIWYPEMFPSATLLGITVGISVALLVGGWWVFRRLEPAVLKEL
ncbi:ABC transporter permease [Asanoa siamensis]|nr:ABC transporter permease [Asanoa siamensis]